MKRTTKRLLAILLCLAVLPVEGFAAMAEGKAVEPPAYMRELSRLVAATASEDDFGRITLTVGEPEMDVDGETQAIDEDAYIAPFIDEEGEVQIPVSVIEEADLNGSGFLSEEELEEQGYDVRVNNITGTVTITEQYGLCRLIVKTTDGKVHDNFGATQEIRVSNNKTVLQYADKFAAAQAADAFAKEENVLFCTPDSICKVSSATTAAYKSWGTTAAGADQFMAGLPDDLPLVTVAVIDTGVDMDHPFLEGRLLENGWDFVQDDDDPDDAHDHGTHCAGIIRDATPDNVKILPIRVMDATGSGHGSVIAEGITYAADSGADIISMSLGGGADTGYLLSDAVQYARSAGVTLCAAAGNERANLDEQPRYPACCEGVITVAASEKTDLAADYSNYGSVIDVAAPGSDILSSVRDGQFAVMSGTSMACPLAAACAALLKAEDMTRTPEDLRAALRERARDAQAPGRDDHMGSGVVYLGELEELQSFYLSVSHLELEVLQSASILVPRFEPQFRTHTCVTYTSSDPSVVVVEEDGRLHAVRSGSADVTVHSGAWDYICSVTVNGSDEITFSDMHWFEGMILSSGDGTAWSYGTTSEYLGTYTGSIDGSPFRFQSLPEEYVTNIDRFLDRGFLKKDGTFWLFGIRNLCSRRTPVMAVKEDGEPLMGVIGCYQNFAYLEDGTVWYHLKMNDPVYTPLRTTDGGILTGVLPPKSGSMYLVTQSGRAYVVKQPTTMGGTINSANPDPFYAVLQTDENGNPLRNVQQIISTDVLFRDGRLVNRKTNTLILTGVKEFFGSSNNRFAPALKYDGTVWDISTGEPITKADGTILSDVVCVQDLSAGNYNALCADGTVWAWGRNGSKSSGEDERVNNYGVLGVGWTDAQVEIWHYADFDNSTQNYCELREMKDYSDTGCSYVVSAVTSTIFDPCRASLVEHATQVMIDDDTPLTNVRQINNCWYIRDDDSVYTSRVLRYFGYAGYLIEVAVYARPFTLFDRQVYWRESDYTFPYSRERVQRITVSKPHMASTVGETFTLTASVFPQDTYERNISWKSSDPSVATVDGTGTVTTKKAGFAVIRAYSLTNDKVWGECVLTVEEDNPALVEVLQYPTKRVFTASDTFSTAGGMLRLTYPDGHVRSVYISPDFCTGYDLTQIGAQTVTIRFAGSAFTYPIHVTSEQNESVPNEIAVTNLAWLELPQRDRYDTDAQTLDLTGGRLLVRYGDGSTREIEPKLSMCSGFDLSQCGAQTVTVTYKGFVVSFPITVADKVGLVWKTLPDNRQYFADTPGDQLSVEGGILLVQYSDGTVEEAALTRQMCSGYDLKHAGNQTVNVRYKNFETSFPITVIEPQVVESFLRATLTDYAQDDAFEPLAYVFIRYENEKTDWVNVTADMCSVPDMHWIGEQTVDVFYGAERFSYTICVNSVPEKIESISVCTPPRVVYYHGAILPGEMDLTGGELCLHFTDGTQQAIPLTEDMLGLKKAWILFGAGSAASNTVSVERTVTYAGKTTTLTIYNSHQKEIKNKELRSLTWLSPPQKTTFNVGDSLEYPGGGGTVWVEFEDGTAFAMTIANCYRSGSVLTDTPGEYTVRFQYEFRISGYYNPYVTVSYTVVDPNEEPDTPPDDPDEPTYKPPYRLIWYRYPTKTVYCLGEALDTTGGRFEAYEYGKVVAVTPEMCTGFDPMQPGWQTVTVSYSGSTLYDLKTEQTATLTFDVFVTELTLENELPQIEVGKCTRILPSFSPVNADGREIIWMSSDETVATVDEYGRVTGIAPGEVEITAQVKDSDATASCIVKVLGDAATPELSVVDGSGAEVRGGFIFGLPAGVTAEGLADYLTAENGSLSADHRIGTGTVVQLLNVYGEAAAEYTVVIFGDLNGDGMVNSTDVTALRSFAAGLLEIEPDGAVYSAADVNGDGLVNSTDLTVLRRQAAGLV